MEHVKKVDTEKLEEFAKTLKAYCESHKNCEGCIFDNEPYCRIMSEPYDWEVDA